MQIHELILVVTVLVCFALHVSRVGPSFAASRRLEEAVRQRGSDPFVGGFMWILQMFRNSKAIFCETDTPEIRALKQDFYDRWHYARKGLPIVIGVAFGGWVLSFLTALVEFVFQKKP